MNTSPVIVINQSNDKPLKRGRGRPKGSLNKIQKPRKNAKVSNQLNYIVEKEVFDNIAQDVPAQNNIVEQIEKQMEDSILKNASPADAMKIVMDKSEQLVESFSSSDPISLKKVRDEIKSNKEKTKKERKQTAQENTSKKRTKVSEQTNQDLFNDYNNNLSANMMLPDFEQFQKDKIDARKRGSSSRKKKYDASIAVQGFSKIIKAKAEKNKLNQLKAEKIKNASNVIGRFAKTASAKKELQKLAEEPSAAVLQGYIKKALAQNDVKKAKQERLSKVLENSVSSGLQNALSDAIKNKTLIKKARENSAYVQAQVKKAKELRPNAKLSGTSEYKVDMRVFGNRTSAIRGIQNQILKDAGLFN